jgi:hypothetical protein
VRRNRLTILLACASLALCCGFGDAGVRAQSLGVTPALVEAQVKRGATYTATYSISNNTATRLRFSCTTGDYWYDETGARVTGQPGTLPRSASAWVQFTPSVIIIEPHSEGTVKALITVPSGANGSFYTTPIFEGEPAAPATQKEGSIVASVMVRIRGLLMLTTEDASEYNVEIMGGALTPPTASSPLEMRLDVRNRGTAHARLRGLFAVINSSGALAGRGSIEEKSYLPGQRSDLQTQWAGELARGSYTAIVTLTYDRAGADPATLVYELPFEVK